MKIGDYVRTYSGFIGKVKYIETDEFGSSTYHFEKTFTEKYDNDIKLVKERPIDLIEVGDYVNGKEVLELKNFGAFNGARVFGDIYFNEEIKSIVTKEMFANAEYRVESN